MPFSVILDPYLVRGRLDPESRKSLKILDPPVKPGDDGCSIGSPSQPFDLAHGRESFDFAQDHGPVEWHVERAGG